MPNLNITVVAQVEIVMNNENIDYNRKMVLPLEIKKYLNVTKGKLK